VNEAVSKGGRGEKFTILRDWLSGSNVIRLRGDCNVAKSEKMNMFPSQDYFIAVAREVLDSLGVPVRNVFTSSSPTGCDTLCTVQRSIVDVVTQALMESDNLCAEALYYHLGALYGKFPVEQKMGAGIVKGYMEYTFDMPEWYDVCDGSGLSPYTLLSADVLLQALKRVCAVPAIKKVFFEALPLSGVSGTMKHRTKGTAAYKRVLAKTGTVTGVCTLAGYAKAANGHTLAFVMLNDGLPKAAPVRAWQDKVCALLCR
jgi:D-alanyl-D-alanine carboxypeptidase/D-alanyl-D-alanine-endopeptidase (penicillin-binding protein 4)